jgi:hypothetical protein
MRPSRGSGLQTDLKPRAVWQLLDISAEIIDKDHRMAGSQGLPAGSKTRVRRSLSKLLGKNVGERH